LLALYSWSPGGSGIGEHTAKLKFVGYQMQIPRRLFLKACAASSLIALAPERWHQLSATTLNDSFAEIRANLLQLVNEERAVEKVPLLKIDDLATRVATAHAQEMAKYGYASHWNREGLKPYHRYAQAGGYHYTKENVSAADNTWSNKLVDLKPDTSIYTCDFIPKNLPTTVIGRQYCRLKTLTSGLELRSRNLGCVWCKCTWRSTWS
jgi:hypothetical protein